MPLLEGLLPSFPFPILGFHADNGSEYINHRVAALLDKLRVERFTKSRVRTSNDNALVEGKNANVVRRWFGHDHIPQRFAPEVNRFAQGTLSPFLNFHRPCLLATEYRDAAGRGRRRGDRPRGRPSRAVPAHRPRHGPRARRRMTGAGSEHDAGAVPQAEPGASPTAVPASRSPLTRRLTTSHPRTPTLPGSIRHLTIRRGDPIIPRIVTRTSADPQLHGSDDFTLTFSLDNGALCRALRDGLPRPLQGPYACIRVSQILPPGRVSASGRWWRRSRAVRWPPMARWRRSRDCRAARGSSVGRCRSCPPAPACRGIG